MTHADFLLARCPPLRSFFFWNSTRVLASRQSLTNCLKNSRDVWRIHAYRSARARVVTVITLDQTSTFFFFPLLSSFPPILSPYLTPSHFFHINLCICICNSSKWLRSKESFFFFFEFPSAFNFTSDTKTHFLMQFLFTRGRERLTIEIYLR